MLLSESSIYHHFYWRLRIRNTKYIWHFSRHNHSNAHKKIRSIKISLNVAHFSSQTVQVIKWSSKKVDQTFPPCHLLRHIKHLMLLIESNHIPLVNYSARIIQFITANDQIFSFSLIFLLIRPNGKMHSLLFFLIKFFSLFSPNFFPHDRKTKFIWI